MKLLSRLRRLFSSRRNVIQTREGAAELPLASPRPYWIVGRGLCMYHCEGFHQRPSRQAPLRAGAQAPGVEPLRAHRLPLRVVRRLRDGVVLGRGQGRRRARGIGRAHRCEGRGAAPGAAGDGVPPAQARRGAPAALPRGIRAPALARGPARRFTLVSRAPARAPGGAVSGPPARRGGRGGGAPLGAGGAGRRSRARALDHFAHPARVARGE